VTPWLAASVSLSNLYVKFTRAAGTFAAASLWKP